MSGLSANLRYFQCFQSTDMRNGFDGLAGIVRNYAILLNLITLAVNTYYDSSLMENCSMRYILFILEVGFTGLIAKVMPFVLR